MQSASPILVAEDSDDDFFLFRRAARSGGLENPILRFRDGAELVNFITKLRPNEIEQNAPWLLFVDLLMPVMNGFEVLEWLGRKKTPFEFLPIVLTGSSNTEDMRRAFALNAYEYLVKPIAPAVFAALMARPPTPLKKRDPRVARAA